MEAGLVVAVALMALAVLALVLMTFRGLHGRGTNEVALNERLDSLNQRLGEVSSQASTYQGTMAAVNHALGELGQVSHRMLEVGQDMQDLQGLLAAPTLRGGVGEFLLETLLSQTLPRDLYRLQHTFRSGHRVDAVIRLREGLVSVDAKFPLESFARATSADNGETGRNMREFRNRVRGHIDDIAQKYICPGETLDFAFMYVPAENVYYEIVLKSAEQGDLLDYAWNRRVFPASPNSLYAYLQVIAQGIRGFQVEQNAKRILDTLSRLGRDFDVFADDYRVIGTHLRNAQTRYDQALPRLQSFQRELAGQTEATVPDSLPDSADGTGAPLGGAGVGQPVSEV